MRIFVLLCLVFMLAGCNASKPYDYLIINGSVYVGDESGVQSVDVAITDRKIVSIGTFDATLAKTVIDASGLVVAPGFIDPHTHSIADLRDVNSSSNEHYLFQGVTTVLSGNDGRGPIEIAAALSAFQKIGVGTNVGLFTGHGTIRERVIGLEDRGPTSDELEAMRAMVRQSIAEGAIGLSTGLYYAPGSFAKTDEIIQLAGVLAEEGGVYDSHIRDESTYSVGLLNAIEEVITIGRKSGVPVHIAHIKALGVDVWDYSDEIISRINSARSDGVRVTADQYPWNASGTRISNALIPNWAKADSNERLIKRLQDPGLTDRLDNEITENIRKRGGGEALLIIGGDADIVGKTLTEIATSWGVTEVQAAKSIVVEGDARVASFNMQESDIRNFMRQPWVMTSSDGTEGHPRKYGSYPRKFSVYVRDGGDLELSEFIHRSSGLVADTFEICGRGYLREGYHADIVVFDPDTFTSNADYSTPKELSSGVTHLFVNGRQVIDSGKFLPVKAGDTIRRGIC